MTVCVSRTSNMSGSGPPLRRSSACTGSRRRRRPRTCARSCSPPGANGARRARAGGGRSQGAAPADAAFDAADRFLAETPIPKLPFSGADLVARGVAAGPRVGETLRAFQALWIRAGFPRQRDRSNACSRRPRRKRPGDQRQGNTYS